MTCRQTSRGDLHIDTDCAGVREYSSVSIRAREFWVFLNASVNRRTLLLAGVAAALIFGGLALKRLSDSRAKKTFTAVDPNSMHNHGPDEPCGESCSKDHKPHDHPLNIMVGMHGFWYH